MTDVISSGNVELDRILKGGFTKNRMYLLEGNPGTGKTTMGLQFLMEGARQGEKGLYVSLSETKHELQAVAASHGWSLDGVDIYELIDPSSTFDADSQYTMFQPSEVELGATTREMLNQVERCNPKRVVLDSLSELRLLAQNPLPYRRQILALKQYFGKRECTAIFLDDKTAPEADLQLQSIAHGVIALERIPAEIGSERRRLEVVKYRGKQYVGGWHDFSIGRGGLNIYPRVVFEQDRLPRAPAKILHSGNESLDQLLGDGIQTGTSTLVIGPAGVGKSTCTTLYAVTACQRGERAMIFAFDETRQTLIQRSAGMGMDLEEWERQGLLEICQVNPGDVSPGEFAAMVRRGIQPSTDGNRVSVIVIDSLNGYVSSMPEERHLQVQMHDLLKFLSSCGIATFLVVAQHGMIGTAVQSPVDASYLADTVMLFRYFEAAGEIRQALSVVKKRDGRHERTIREFRIENGRVLVGEPLRQFHGILAGTPSFHGSDDDLIRNKRRDAKS